jgi:hypothetical protein
MTRYRRGSRRLAKAKRIGPFADPEPAIITYLRVICGQYGREQDRLKWAHQKLEVILEDWDRDENMDQLRSSLGVNPAKKRRLTETARRDLEITTAIVNAALRGEKQPKGAAAKELNIPDIRAVQRAWERWGAIQIRMLMLVAQRGDKKMDTAINPHEVGIRGRFLPAGTSVDGDEARGLVRAGALKGLSAGINPQEVEPLNDGTRGLRIVKAELLEVSLCAIPASVDAKVIAARSLAARPASAALLRSMPRIADSAIERAVASVGRARAPGRPLMSYSDSARTALYAAEQRQRTMAAWALAHSGEVQERERYSFEARQADLRALSGESTH